MKYFAAKFALRRAQKRLWEVAERNMEQLVTSVLDTLLLDPRRKLRGQRLAEWEAFAREMAEVSSRFYRNLVYETPGFMDFFRQSTPIDLIEGLRLGWRPSRRSGAGGLNELRAIPWVFAWTQSRHFIPAWYGLGLALEKFARDHAPWELQLLREMYRD